MQAFLWATAGNTIFAALLGVAVWLAGRLLQRRPALLHALWILVLLKLVTPPIHDPTWYFHASTDAGRPGARREAVAESASSISIEESIPESIAILESQLRRAQEAKSAHNFRPWWPTLLIAAWVVGSLGFLTLSLYRAMRFSWLLRSAALADLKLIEIAKTQADRLGLRQLPTIKVVSACVSPLVWQTPAATSIILPQKLASDLSPEQLRLLLAHELAHVKRGDPLIRWFALGVLTIHWWNPIVWLAVRQIEAAQEACCDSLVLTTSGASPKRYAEMLLSTVDFLAGQETPPPALAAGFTSGSSLKGRCEMILSKRTPFALARTTRWTLAVLGLAILPLSAPLLGQEEKKPSGDELAARVANIEKALEEMKALLTNRANEEQAVRQKLEAANAELAAKVQQRQAEEDKLREKIDVARARAETERAAAMKELANAQAAAGKKSAEEAVRMQREIQEKVQAELAKVQEEVARATKHSAEAAAKLAQDLAKSHGDHAAKYAEKLSADVAAKIKDQVAHAEKRARDHADHAEKFAKEHAKHFEKHAKEFEEHAKHAEKFAQEHAKHFQEHAEKFAKDAEKHAKQAVEQELPKLKEHLAKMKDQMKVEAEKMAKAAEELSKNPEMKKEYEALKEKMHAFKDQWKAAEEKELSKMKSMLKEYRLKEEVSPSDKLKERRIEGKLKEEKAKDDARADQRRELEQQLREREERIRALQREVEKLRKELGGADRQPRRNRGADTEEIAEVPVLSKIPHLGRLFRNKNSEDIAEIAEELEEVELDADLEETMDIEVDVDLEEIEIEEPAEVEEAKAERIDRLIERKFRNQKQDAPSAIEVLKRASKSKDEAPVKP